MKINDKALACYSTCKAHIDKQGWLWKKGELNTSYQKRWCVLRGNLFFYFEKRYDKEPVGVIVIENCSVQLAEGGDSPFTFSISFDGYGLRTYKLTADDEESCNDWVRAVSICSYSYLQILVEGLEKELSMLKLEKSKEQPKQLEKKKSSQPDLKSVTNAVEFPLISFADSETEKPQRSQSIPDFKKYSLLGPPEVTMERTNSTHVKEKPKKSPKPKRKKNKQIEVGNFYVEAADNLTPTSPNASPQKSIAILRCAQRPFTVLHSAYRYEIEQYIGPN